ncbi:MAG: substrate-binding domain-containing protein [Candidatus Dormibacteraeota bacterium]|nr:substrate-binding domain-containing protein [Candidatus Dormibacteraeota bacterium]
MGNRRLLAVLAAAVVLAVGCGTSSTSSGSTAKKGKIAVLLPDSQSSSRWENDDRKFFGAAFQAAGLKTSDYIIQNAGGVASTQQTQADAAITNGATVLLLVNLDSGSGATIEKNAAAKGVKTIDYDRLTLNGVADYYVSFDNVSVGKLQGQGLVKCLTDKSVANPKIVELNGSPTDNNATLFKQGYDSVLQPKYASSQYTKVADQSVPAWDNQQALTIFEQIIAAHPQVDGVLAANDGLGNAVVSALKSRQLNGKIPVTGQDATAEGIQNIIAGDQCMTVYKAIKKEADAAAKLALELRNGTTPAEATGSVNNQTKDVKSVLLIPVAVTKTNIKSTVLADKFRTVAEICPANLAQACASLGLS